VQVISQSTICRCLFVWNYCHSSSNNKKAKYERSYSFNKQYYSL